MKARLALLALVLLLAPGYRILRTADRLPIRWNAAVVPFLINPAGGPAGTRPAILLALEAWNGAGADFRFTDGRWTRTGCNGRDRVNVCCFEPLGRDGVVARNRLTYDPATGFLRDSDIQFNTAYGWSVAGEAGKMDVRNVATHELGHSLALNDLYNPESVQKTMYGVVRFGERKKRTLHPDDVNGIRRLYPW